MLGVGSQKNIKYEYVSGGECSSCSNKFQKLFKHFSEIESQHICFFCYTLQNIALYGDNIIVCRGNLPQKDIISKTIEYIRQNSSLPPISYFDKVVKTNISITEVCRIISNSFHLLSELSICFIFNDTFDINMVGFSKSLFDDDEEFSEIDTNENKKERSNINKSEKKLLRKSLKGVV